MQGVFVTIFKIWKKILQNVLKPFDQFFTWIIFYLNGVKISSFKSTGTPKINIGLRGKCVIGPNFKMNNRESSNPIGRFHRCSIFVSNGGYLTVGENVGMSSTTIVCHDEIRIGNNVNLGGNVVVYDTDFHSLNPSERLNRETDIMGTKTKPVKIGNNVFIGAHSTILKGVEIGDNAIVGACSVVTKDIPTNEIWAGNPARKIRSFLN